MSRKNSGFGAELVAGIDLKADVMPKRSSIAANVLTGRANRIAELASGNVVSRVHELVDPARCRMWSGHNREYGLLNEQRCSDLIESIKAQGRQEIPAIVRRVSGNADFDYEVICGARRHWTISWLRSHNYPDFKFLVDIREIGDEEAFRLADIENRARDDLTDLERAKDYLRALKAYYDGRQKTMAERINVSESWLTRYLDLARLPSEVMVAFPEPQALSIRNVIALKPLLKSDESRNRVFREASALAARQEKDGLALPVLDVIRALVDVGSTPKHSPPPKRSGSSETVVNSVGKVVLRIDGADRKGVRLTLLNKGGATREDADKAIQDLLDQYWS